MVTGWYEIADILRMMNGSNGGQVDLLEHKGGLLQINQLLYFPFTQSTLR